MTLYVPDAAEIGAVANRTTLANTHPTSRPRLMTVLRGVEDWDQRVAPTPPGVVWSVQSDNCWTGPPTAPFNIGRDDCGFEFVFRQPRSETELGAVMSAYSQETFECYRFDGLERWTAQSAAAWFDSTEPVVLGWLKHLKRADDEDEGLRNVIAAHLDYLSSQEYAEYRVDILAWLRTAPTAPSGA